MRILMIALCALGATTTGAIAAIRGADLASQAKISLEAARATALNARPGKVTDEELEKEKGGSGLRYSFDMVSAGVAYEVGVDAETGVVLENAPEGKGRTDVGQRHPSAGNASLPQAASLTTDERPSNRITVGRRLTE